jgi:archaellum biogenesis protein FlaJ (TadC family)
MVATAGTIVTSDAQTAIQLLTGALVLIVIVVFVVPNVFIRTVKRPLRTRERIYLLTVLWVSAFYLVTFETCAELGLPFCIR